MKCLEKIHPQNKKQSIRFWIKYRLRYRGYYFYNNIKVLQWRHLANISCSVLFCSNRTGSKLQQQADQENVLFDSFVGLRRVYKRRTHENKQKRYIFIRSNQIEFVWITDFSAWRRFAFSQCILVLYSFYRATLCVARYSHRNFVCLSVCHTRGLCPHGSTYNHGFFIYGSPIILVFRNIKFIPKFEGDHPERGRWMRVGTNWRFSTFKPTKVRPTIDH